jgi:hypothetical protein
MTLGEGLSGQPDRRASIVTDEPDEPAVSVLSARAIEVSGGFYQLSAGDSVKLLVEIDNGRGGTGSKRAGVIQLATPLDVEVHGYGRDSVQRALPPSSGSVTFRLRSERLDDLDRAAQDLKYGDYSVLRGALDNVRMEETAIAQRFLRGREKALRDINIDPGRVVKAHLIAGVDRPLTPGPYSRKS